MILVSAYTRHMLPHKINGPFRLPGFIPEFDHGRLCLIRSKSSWTDPSPGIVIVPRIYDNKSLRRCFSRAVDYSRCPSTSVVPTVTEIYEKQFENRFYQVMHVEVLIKAKLNMWGDKIKEDSSESMCLNFFIVALVIFLWVTIKN